MATLQEQLTEARAAYHRLQLGESAVSFTDQNGEKVEYRAATVQKLAAYINDLERQILGLPRKTTLHFATSKGLT
jgi:gpW